MKVRRLLFVLMTISLLISCKKDEEVPVPVVDFKVESIGDNYEVTFKNISEFGNEYIWDFGDGKTSLDKSPIHTFIQGKYNVSLTVKNSSGTKELTKEVILESQEKVAVQLLDATSITNAGFNMNWNVVEGRAGSSYHTFVQVSDKKDFSTSPEVYEAVSVGGSTSEEFISIYPPHTQLYFRNLIPNKQYYFRVKLVYSYAGNEEDILSETKSIRTQDMPIPHLDVTGYSNSKTYFSVNTSLVDFSGFFTNSPINKIEFSLDKNFTEKFVPERIKWRNDTYYKEAGETIYVRSTYTYNGVSKSISKSVSLPEAFIDGDDWKGDRAIAYDYNGKKIFEIGASDGKRIFFQIANFNGVGEYPLEGDPDNTVDDTYAYLLSGDPLRKYTLKHLSTMPLTLYIYKDANGSFYGRIGDTTDSNTYMSFRAENGSSDSISGIIFKALKQSNTISKEMSNILGKYKGNFNIYNEISVKIECKNKDTVIINQPLNTNTDKTFPILAHVKFNDVDSETSLYIPRQYIKTLDSYIVGNKIPILGKLFNDPRNGRIDNKGELTYSIIKDNDNDLKTLEDGNIFLGGIKIN